MRDILPPLVNFDRVTVQEALQLAVQHHQAGRFAEAEHIYRQILQQQPSVVDAMTLLALLLIATRRVGEAAEVAQRAVAASSEDYQARLALADALLNLGRGAEAVEHYRKSLTLYPGNPPGWVNLSLALRQSEQIDEAITALHEAIRLDPDFVDAYNNLGVALMEAGRTAESLAAFERAVQLRPNDARLRVNLARGLEWLGRFNDALQATEAAVQLDPTLAEAWNQMAIDYAKLNQPQKAIEACRTALRYDPQLTNAHINLGNALKEQGLIEEAIAQQRTALSIDPNHPMAWSNLLYLLHFDARSDGAAILKEHQAWARLKADPLRPDPLRFSNDRNTQRRLRIGYVSPDLRRHPVGIFLLPLLANHDRDRFHISCYADVLTPDKVTDQLRAHADAWHSTAPLSVAALAEQVRRDEIDILVDLTLHAAGNRLLMFARKPAPVQVTYLGYPSTTGMTAMDWKLTDRFLDPPGRSEQFSSERLAYLESTYWCYRQPLAEVPVSEPPLRTRGQVTFGCFNNFARVSNDAVSAWCRILAATPTSRLILHADPGEHRLRISKNMAAQGIHDDRFEFVEHVKTAKYFERHAMIDIALDPFPYCGGTTTCDALWMGVPAVSLVGDIAVRRAGLSILSRVGLAELAVDSVDAYVQMAIELASDVERLTQLRRELRDRMSASPLMDAPAFARDVERLYRQMWIDWVAANPSR